MTAFDLSVSSATPALRPATPDDAPHLARFVVAAGEGMPLVFWAEAAGPGESVWDVGTARARRDTGAFSWRNATIATIDGRVVGGAISYPLPDVPEGDDTSDRPAIVRPLLALEARAPGHVYLNVLAVDPEARGRGVARALLDAFEASARVCGRTTAIIVDDANVRAFDLYRGFGYREIAREAIVTSDRWRAAGEHWVLLTKG
ncbi:GNAT family N-acetyltransferase [Salinarimonas chemoclinalis]|uniref:GNAT family N-acetyltransferase n=1 Tax=Salinarimonas chemoclinalis TaxID=3241599 RepID=UPI0035582C11